LPAVLGVSILLQGPIAAAGLAEGYTAYVSGEYEIAYTELLPVARAGDYNAGYYLGLLYWEGNGVEKDLATAVVWLSDAAARGHAGAQLSMALAYENGQGVERNYHRGAELMSEAAHGGHPDAQYLLGTYYRDGRGVVQDQLQAYVWSERSVVGDRSNALFLDALLMLGAAREWGRGLPQDLLEAYKWYALAAGYSANEIRIYDSAGRAMGALSTRMTVMQISEAQRRADEWVSRR
jgi:TPR repeat protein